MTVIVSAFSPTKKECCLVTDLAATNDDGSYRTMMSTKTACVGEGVFVAFAGDPACLAACRTLKVRPPRSVRTFDSWLRGTMFDALYNQLEKVAPRSDWSAVVATRYGTAAITGGFVVPPIKTHIEDISYVIEGSGGSIAAAYIEGLSDAALGAGSKKVGYNAQSIAKNAVLYTCRVVPSCYGVGMVVVS